MVTRSIPNTSGLWTKEACDACSGNYVTIYRIQETALNSQNATYKFTLRTQQGILTLYV